MTLLALARLFAPEPATSDPTDHTETVAPPHTNDALRPVVFIPRASHTETVQAARDLRNPFDPRTLRMVKAASRSGTKAAPSRDHDLRDPFAERPGPRRRLDADPDLRDPFVRPQDRLPKCPDTQGVPIQRPESVQARCAQASRRAVFARR